MGRAGFAGRGKSVSQLFIARERAGFLKRCGVSGRKPERECFPSRPGKLGLWGKAKSGVRAAGFD
jgi:hypothetical protein